MNVDESTFKTASDEQQNLDQMGLYLQDQMSWNNWEWLVSGRYDWSEVRTNDFTDNSFTQQNDSKFTAHWPAVRVRFWPLAVHQLQHVV